jgi:hypothetical protein
VEKIGKVRDKDKNPLSINAAFVDGFQEMETILMQGTSTGEKYTRNEWRRCKTTLETSGEDVKLHSKRVEKM